MIKYYLFTILLLARVACAQEVLPDSIYEREFTGKHFVQYFALPVEKRAAYLRQIYQNKSEQGALYLLPDLIVKDIESIADMNFGFQMDANTLGATQIINTKAIRRATVYYKKAIKQGRFLRTSPTTTSMPVATSGNSFNIYLLDIMTAYLCNPPAGRVEFAYRNRAKIPSALLYLMCRDLAALNFVTYPPELGDKRSVEAFLAQLYYGR